MVVHHGSAELLQHGAPLASEVPLELGDVLVPLTVQHGAHLLHLLLAVEQLAP